MRSDNVIQVFMIIIAISCILTRRRFFSILCMAALSIFSAILYVLYQAPDVALAEIVIGSAFIPLIFIITILKVKDFKVVDYTNDSFLTPGHQGYQLLDDLCNSFNLDINIIQSTTEESSPSNIFRTGNPDIIITKSKDSNHYVIKGCVDSLMMCKLEKLVEKEPNIDLILVEDVTTDE